MAGTLNNAPARAGGAMWLDITTKKLYLFGGYSTSITIGNHKYKRVTYIGKLEPYPFALQPDTYSVDISSVSDSAAAPVSFSLLSGITSIPPGVIFPAKWTRGRVTYLFGGFNTGTTQTNAFWRFDATTESFTEIRAAGAATQGAIMDFSASYIAGPLGRGITFQSSQSSSLGFVFTGETTGYLYTREIWAFNFTTEQFALWANYTDVVSNVDPVVPSSVVGAAGTGAGGRYGAKTHPFE
jgi:hypothetical protein